MLKVFKPSTIALLKYLAILLLVAKFMALGCVLVLPSDGVEHVEVESYVPPYNRYAMTNILSETAANADGADGSMSSGGASASEIALKGLFGKGRHGMVIVAMRSNIAASEVIGVGESFMGYELKSINASSALFVKDTQEYLVEMYDASMPPPPANETIDGPLLISKGDIANYSKNPKQIWKEISMAELKENGVIKGFRVTRIDERSVFKRLGLRIGDVITKANNVELKSYKEALNIYENIENIESIELVFLRDNQQQEIVYDIR